MKTARPITRSSLSSSRDPNAVLAALLGPRFVAYRAAWDEAAAGKRPAFPLHLDLDVISSCQLSCPMCPAGQPESPFPGLGRVLPETTLEAALVESQKNQLPALRLGVTGEPLLLKNIAQYVQAARDRGVLDVALITNGQNLWPEMSQALIAAGLTRLMVSVDAATESTYRLVRPGGDWARLKSNLRDFLAIRASLKSPLPLLRLSFVDLALNAADKPLFERDFGPLADYLTFQSYQSLGGLPNLNPGLDNAPPASLSPGDVCLEPRCRLALHADGGLFPCCSDFGRLQPLGYFPALSLSQAWNSAPARELARDQGAFPQCRACQAAGSGQLFHLKPPNCDRGQGVFAPPRPEGR